MIRLAVIGKDVSQSDSPAIHNFILRRFHAEHSYEKVSIPPQLFPSEAEKLFFRYDGFNVTIPFKQEIIPYLKELIGDAKDFGAVNTVVTASRTGHNTDGGGFLLMLKNAKIPAEGSVLVLGAGGAGRSCIKKLCGAGAQVFVYERDSARLAAVFDELGGFIPLERVPKTHFDLILNCTGVGMHDTAGRLPCVRFEEGEGTCEPLLAKCGRAVDLIYVPKKSEFLRVAEGYKKPILSGGAMLFYQAYLSDCIYLGIPADAEEAGKLYRKYTEEAS